MLCWESQIFTVQSGDERHVRLLCIWLFSMLITVFLQSNFVPQKKDKGFKGLRQYRRLYKVHTYWKWQLNKEDYLTVFLVATASWRIASFCILYQGFIWLQHEDTWTVSISSFHTVLMSLRLMPLVSPCWVAPVYYHTSVQCFDPDEQLKNLTWLHLWDVQYCAINFKGLSAYAVYSDTLLLRAAIFAGSVFFYLFF